MTRLHVYIPESLEEDMREFILTSYHRYERGQLSSLVIEALRLYLDPGTHTQKRKSTRYSNHKLDLFMSQINDYLVSNCRYEQLERVSEKHINQAIANIKDIKDKRPINDWREKLEAGKYIERVEYRLFKILKKGIEKTKTVIEDLK
jgi:hypothetical protein